MLSYANLTAQSLVPSDFPSSTEDRVRSPGWWPTKGSAALSDFVGSAVCANCHQEIAATQFKTPMAQACSPAASSQVLRAHPRLAAKQAEYHYEISDGPTSVNFSVTDETHSLSATIEWAFGLGRKGQTFLYERDGQFYESRLSFYKTLQGLALTTGHSASPPGDLKSAMGRSLGANEKRRCFGCHSTGSATENHFDTSQLTPGVTCEACHGPGASHVAAMNAGDVDLVRDTILNPRQLTPVASVDFCGACHRTWTDVMEAGSKGVINTRFQPYGLENSKCWRKTEDARLTCIACHDPHEQLVQEASYYDQKCLACHKTSPATSASGQQKSLKQLPGAACPVSKTNCVTCHMPKIEIPGIHAAFTDHDIRIVRARNSHAD